MKRTLYLCLAAAAAVGLLIWWFSPSQAVKRRTKSLLSTISLEKDSGLPARNLKVYALNARLAQEVELDTPTIGEANGTFERSQLESGFSWMSANARESAFKIERFNQVTVDGDRASVSLTLDGLVELKSYRPVDGRYEVEMDWRREDDGWRLTRASWREAR